MKYLKVGICIAVLFSFVVFPLTASSAPKAEDGDRSRHVEAAVRMERPDR